MQDIADLIRGYFGKYFGHRSSYYLSEPFEECGTEQYVKDDTARKL
ncbi:MAG: hypothetical protein OXG98_11065 [Gemmatimonadetes bacterium]|nr:hypothetical protein [Gemmatimonadota bacterium]